MKINPSILDFTIFCVLELMDELRRWKVVCFNTVCIQINHRRRLMMMDVTIFSVEKARTEALVSIHPVVTV